MVRDVLVKVIPSVRYLARIVGLHELVTLFLRETDEQKSRAEEIGRAFSAAMIAAIFRAGR